MSEHKYILLTGAASGIGKETVYLLSRSGYTIFAGVRKQEDSLQFEKEKNIIPIILDITDTQSVLAAKEKIIDHVKENGLYAVINNAAIAIGGPLEFIDVDMIRKQFETNVFAHIGIIQTFLPLIRKGMGRILNIGSSDGYIITPFFGAYSATKFAMESITYSLRCELKAWKIPVIIIVPGIINTPMWSKALSSAEQALILLSQERVSLYQGIMGRSIARAKDFNKKCIAPEVVARVIVKAVSSKTPKDRYFAGIDALLMYYMSLMIPDRINYWVLSKIMGMI